MINIEFISPDKSATIVRSVNGMTGDVILEIPEVDMTGVATEEFVERKIAEAALGGDINLDSYATDEELQAAIKEIELTPGPAGKDGEDYVLTEEDKAEIALMVPSPDVDLTEYYTKTEIDALLADLPVGEVLPAAEGVEF